MRGGSRGTQAVVGDAPGEPVPEGIGDVREQTRLVQELARPQVGERAMQLIRRRVSETASRSASGTSSPITAASCSAVFSAALSRSIRAAMIAATLAGTSIPSGSADEAVGAARAGQHASVDQVAYALFEEQRIALARLPAAGA